MDESSNEGAERDQGSEESKEIAVRRADYQVSRDALHAEMQALNRDAFRRVLVDFIGYAPSPEAIQKLAEKAPDRWIQGLTMLSSLAGYKRDVSEVNNIVVIGSMSDSDLMKRLALVEQQHAEAGKMIEITQVNTPSELSPSRDDTIIDVKAKVLK